MTRKTAGWLIPLLLKRFRNLFKEEIHSFNTWDNNISKWRAYSSSSCAEIKHVKRPSTSPHCTEQGNAPLRYKDDEAHLLPSVGQTWSPPCSLSAERSVQWDWPWLHCLRFSTAAFPVRMFSDPLLTQRHRQWPKLHPATAVSSLASVTVQSQFWLQLHSWNEFLWPLPLIFRL